MGSSSKDGETSRRFATSFTSVVCSSGTVLSGSTSFRVPIRLICSFRPSLPLWSPRSMNVVENERCRFMLGYSITSPRPYMKSIMNRFHERGHTFEREFGIITNGSPSGSRSAPRPRCARGARWRVGIIAQNCARIAPELRASRTCVASCVKLKKGGRTRIR